MFSNIMRRLHLALGTIACAVLGLCVAAQASAAGDDFGEIKALELRVSLLERRVLSEMPQEKFQLDDDLKEIRADITQLKTQAAAARTDISALQAEVAKLKAQQPTDPNKPPKPSDPPKPADGQTLTLRAPFIVKDNAGRVVFQVDVPADRGQPRAVVGNPAGAHVEMGPTPGGASALGLFDESKKLLVAMVGDPQRSFLRIRDNEQSVALGNVESLGTGLFLRKGEQPIADLSADKAGAGTVRIFGTTGKAMASLSSIPEGGTLKTFDAKEKAVAGVFAGADGGHVVLNGPGGAKTAVHLSVTETGGKVRVFPAAGGKARAELIADGENGAIAVFNSQGTSAVVLESASSGAGHLVILNDAGENAVEAGVMKGGTGIVRAGPAGSGPAGSLGGGLLPASSIQGKKGGK